MAKSLKTHGIKPLTAMVGTKRLSLMFSESLERSDGEENIKHNR